MDENAQGDHFADTEITTSFSQLLFSDINENDVFCSGLGPLFDSSSSPKMLCFDGGFNHRRNDFPAACCNSSDSVITNASAAGSAATTAIGVKSNVNACATKPNRRINESSESVAIAQRSCKKIKKENPCNSIGQTKARKEKLGERIAALQQLVSPFGKTDTASVLHEAMGYIRFLHDQLQVLCSPYLQQSQPLSADKENGTEEPEKELRGMGLCLVPVESTIHVANSNGADYWSPAMSATRQ